jgi:hypothetical protein
MHVCALDSMRVWRFPVGVDVSTHQRGDDRPRYRRGRLILGVGVLLLVVAAVWWFFWSGGFRFQPEHGETFWHLLHQKGHWYLEMVISGVETILFDLLIGVIGWRYLLRPYIAERQRRAVEDDHALHGILDHDGRRTRAEGVGH